MSPGEETALKFALQRGHTASVDLLLKSGAKEEAAGEQPVRRPSPPGSVREAAARYLLQHDADRLLSEALRTKVLSDEPSKEFADVVRQLAGTDNVISTGNQDRTLI
jgi:hypothetical protein